MNRKLIAAFVLGAVLALGIREAGTAFASRGEPTLPDLAGLIHVRALADVPRVRAQVTREVFGGPLPGDEPAWAREVPAPAPAVHAVQFPGDGYLLSAAQPNGKLAIYHAGHDQRALGEGWVTVRTLLDAGYDVLALSMPAGPHERFAGQAHPLRPFLAPVAQALNYALARKAYSETIMTGLSGGGWTTVVYSALDPRILRSYPVAGSWPFYLRKGEAAGTVGDFEQALPGLSVGYLDLYLLAAAEGREQVQVFNLNDPCCFAGTASLQYEEPMYLRALALRGSFGVVVVANDVHSLPRSLARVMWASAPPRL